MLLDQPHHQLRSLLQDGAPVFLPVNPVEYHGPHLSLHNDALVSRGLARDIHARLQQDLGQDWPLLLCSDLEVGVDPTPGPGSRPVPYPVVRRLVLEACNGLHELGARRVVLLSFHGAPLHNIALQAGVDWLQARGVAALAPLNLLFQQLFDLDPAELDLAWATIADLEIRETLRRSFAQDFHAGFFETSVALHYAPDSVSSLHRQLPPCPPLRMVPLVAGLGRLLGGLGLRGPARELGFAAEGLGWYGLRPFPGYTGRPDLANAEAGRIFAERLVEDFSRAAQQVFDGAPPPRPLMAWLRWLSLGGRLGGVHVPLEQVLRVEA